MSRKAWYTVGFGLIIAICVAAFMLQLERRPFFLAPSLESIEQVKVEGSQTIAFSFTLHCPLDPAIHTDTTPVLGDSLGSAR